VVAEAGIRTLQSQIFGLRVGVLSAYPVPFGYSAGTKKQAPPLLRMHDSQPIRLMLPLVVV
jgi:hypothetical protein